MTIIPRDTLRDFLSRYAAPGATFPTGARMQAAGAAHGEADVLDCGYDYEHSVVALSIAEWVSMRDARAYLLGYKNGREAAELEAARKDAANHREVATQACRKCGRTDDLHVQDGIAECHPCMLDADLARHFADQKRRASAPTW